MEPIKWITVAVILLLTASAASMLSDARGDHSGEYDECEARCARLTGDSRYKCVKMCVSSKRRHGPTSRNETKNRMEECEELCEDYKGVDRVRCIRICLDRIKQYKTERKVIVKEKASEDPCDSRCGMISGTMKEKCLTRCRRETRFRSR